MCNAADGHETRRAESVDDLDGNMGGYTGRECCRARDVQRGGWMACAHGNVLYLAGVDAGLCERRLGCVLSGCPLPSNELTAHSEKRRQHFVHRRVLELALLRPPHRRPLHKGEHDVVCPLLPHPRRDTPRQDVYRSNSPVVTADESRQHGDKTALVSLCHLVT